jgi:hypothetical protein
MDLDAMPPVKLFPFFFLLPLFLLLFLSSISGARTPARRRRSPAERS